MTVEDGTTKEDYLLDSPEKGLYIPPLIWGVQSGHSADCVMLVLTSDVYQESGYLRKYEEFLAWVKGASAR